MKKTKINTHVSSKSLQKIKNLFGDFWKIFFCIKKLTKSTMGKIGKPDVQRSKEPPNYFDDPWQLITTNNYSLYYEKSGDQRPL